LWFFATHHWYIFAYTEKKKSYKYNTNALITTKHALVSFWMHAPCTLCIHSVFRNFATA
jgi:hypothetical protein